MFKLIVGFAIFIGSFYSHANSSCIGAWVLNGIFYKDKQPSFPYLVKSRWHQLHLKIKDIVPDIEMAELEILPETDSLLYNRYNRHGEKFYKIAKWKGEAAFLKKIKPPHGEKELATLRIFNQIGVPTLFRGVVRDTDGTLYMVSKFQKGATLRNQEDVLENVNEQYHESVRQQVREIKIAFSELGVLYTDFQFMVSAEGKVYLIDVEYYQFLGKTVPRPVIPNGKI